MKNIINNYHISCTVEYIISKYGDICPSGLEVATEARCLDAASRLSLSGLRLDAARNYGYRQIGCLTDGKDAYFNIVGDSSLTSPSIDFAAICYRPGKEGRLILHFMF